MKDNFDGQIAKVVYLKNMAAMKEVLRLGEFKIGNRDSEEYKYFKRIVMDGYYNNMSEMFRELENLGILQKCECGATIRKGYKPCPKCNGAGHCNSDSFNDYISDLICQKKVNSKKPE